MTMQPTSHPVGLQEPRIRVLPAAATSFRLGDAALRLADRLGRAVIDLIPWQEGVVNDLCATTVDNQFAAAAAGLVVARQNGKGGALELRVVAGVTQPQFGERRILWTANTAKTARDAHARVAKIFLSHPDLRARLKGGSERTAINYGNDLRTITLRDGREIWFFTRSAAAGRGLWGDMLILDEALDLTEEELTALRFTLRTAARRTGRRAQTIYVSTPPDEDKHKNGLVFARMRKRALTGLPVPEHPSQPILHRGSGNVGWIEFSVPTLDELVAAAEAEGRKLIGDPRLPGPEVEQLPPEALQLWQQGNPSLGYLFDLGVLLNDKTEFGDRSMLVEGLAAPDYWPDPDPVEAGDPAMDYELWKARRDPASRAVDPVALGLEVSPRRVATLSVVGWRADGRKHGEQIWSGPEGAAVGVLLKVVDKIDPATLVIDGRGKASSLLPEIRAAGLEPQILTTGERSQADDGLVRDIETDQLRLPGEPMPEMDAAAESATWRSSGDVKFFDRGAGPGVSQLVSLSLARLGLLTVAAQPPKPPPAKALPLDDVQVSEHTGVFEQVDISTASF